MTGPKGRAAPGRRGGAKRPGGPKAILSAWKRLAGAGAAAGAGLGLLVFACVLVAVAAPRQSLDLRTRALRHSIAEAPALTTSVLGTIDYHDFDIGFPGPFGAADISLAQARLAGNLARQHLPLAGAAADWGGLSTAFTPVSGASRRAYDGGTPPQLEVLYRDALSRHARLAAGRMPVGAHAGRAGADFQVAVTRAVAARFGLRPGSRLRLGPAVTLTVTGVITPVAPRSAYWTADVNAAMPTLNVVFRGPSYWIGGVFVAPSEVPALQRWFNSAKIQLAWDFPLSLGHLDAAQARVLASRLAGAQARAGELFLGPQAVPTSVGLASGLPGLVSAFIAEDNAIARVTGLLSVSLAVIGAVVILLAAQLLGEHRSAEFAVMRARGASRRQVAMLALRAGAAAAVPAAAAGAALAVALTPGYSDPLAWWLAGLALAVALAGPTLTASGGRAVGGTGRRRPDRAVGRHAAVRRLVVEVTLAAAAVGGLIVLRQQGPAASGGDLYTSAVPVLLAVPAAVVAMRCYPLVVRGLLRLAGTRPGVTAFVGLARAARTPVSAILPGFALVLTLAVVAFGAMVNAAVYRGQVAASWQRVGADAIVDASASPVPLGTAQQRAIAAVPGTERTAGVVVASGATASGQPVGVLAVNPARYAALVASTPRPPFPAAELARPAGGGPVPVLASRLAAVLVGKGNTTLGFGLGKMPIRIAGTTGSIPGAPGGTFLVVPTWALGAAPPPPTVMLVTGPHLDERMLRATARRAVPGATVTLRSHVLAALTGAPLPHGANAAFAEVAVAAAGFSLLILLITLVLSARSREFTLARLRVMGLGRSQARWVAAMETLPQILAATAGGIAAAWALALLVSPAINLASFTGTGTGVPIRPEPVPLAATAAGLVGLALLALAGQVVLADRRAAARALRVAE